MFKFLAARVLADKYEISKSNLFLPTGCDYIFEEILRKENLLDEYGGEVEIIDTNIRYILGMAIPVLGIAILVFKIIWRYKLMYKYLSPVLLPSCGEWERLLYCIIPSVFYYKVWRKN